ncbi:MAG: hypothetical protein CMB79_00190, partial [Filomicrobium sp.]|nr:hypothetical protein [Filomicrobium sp.]
MCGGHSRFLLFYLRDHVASGPIDVSTLHRSARERPSLALLSISPRQQLVDLIDLVIGDAAEDIR